MPDETDGLDDAPGWKAIDNALWPIYGDREPHHFGTIISYALGGRDPIHGISAYKNLEPITHWHFLTYGFSELWQKTSHDPEVSGFGFELTFRPVCGPGDEKPPNFALGFLQNLGRYVFESGHGFGVGHTLPLNGPIQQGSATLIHATAFAQDPQLPPISTPNGRVEFLQIVGLTMDELQAVSSWNAAAFLELRSQTDPLLLTDLSRQSWLADAQFAAEVARRTNADGSSCGWLSLALQCDTRSDRVRVSIQSIAVEGLRRRLLGRLPFDRELTLNGKEATAIFKPGRQTKLELTEDAVIITLSEHHLAELVDSLHPRAGHYPIPGVTNARLDVLRTEITDSDGKVVDVVG